MSLKIKKGKHGFFFASGTIGGNRIRQSLKTGDRRKAEEVKAQLEARLWAADVYGVKHVALFEDAALSYLEDGNSPRFVAPILAHFRGRHLKSITPKDIRDAARSIYPTGAGSTRNRQAITPARAIINHAADQGLCDPIKVKGFEVAQPKRVAVGMEWIMAFRAAAKDRGHDGQAALCWFMFETGARISEATGLTIADVDMINCRADFGKTKNGEHQTAEFSTELRDEIAKLHALNGQVFGYANKSGVYGPWKNICKDAGIPYIPPHQAGRHSLATHLNNEGWSANDIAAAGRWKSVRLVQDTYIHAEDRGKLASNAIGKLLASSRTAKPVSVIKLRDKLAKE